MPIILLPTWDKWSLTPELPDTWHLWLFWHSSHCGFHLWGTLARLLETPKEENYVVTEPSLFWHIILVNRNNISSHKLKDNCDQIPDIWEPCNQAGAEIPDSLLPVLRHQSHRPVYIYPITRPILPATTHYFRYHPKHFISAFRRTCRDKFFGWCIPLNI